MKKIAFLFLIIISFVIFLLSFNSQPKIIEKDRITKVPSLTPKKEIQEIQKEKNLLFIPYWAIPKNKLEDTNYDKYIYFGIAANEKGIDKEDKGYLGLEKFLKISNSNENLLVVRMVDSKINSLVLDDKTIQNKIIEESTKIAKENGFSGIILDFEFSSLSFESVIKKINSFYEDYYKSVKNNNLVFKITIYGDTFYRLRPYDISFLEKHSDMIFIMAYDFHKARGNPGPNFPLFGKEKYGYDYSQMLSDFTKLVSKEKIGIIFGLYGYDWTMDDKNQSIDQATAESFIQIKNKFLEDCNFKNCLVKRDEKSRETEITYEDKNNQKHVVWFEDLKSVEKKKEYLKKQGINTFIYWAYSYF